MKLYSAVIFLIVAVAPALRAQAQALPDADTLHRQIQQRYRPMYEKFIGVESKTRSENRVINTETKEVKEETTLVTVARNYFYEKREARALSYVKNGEVQDPEDFKQRGQGDPLLPIWDEHGREHYRIRVKGREVFAGQDCYVIEIIPKKNTSRHLKGTAYVNAEELNLVHLDATMADPPFGVQRLSFKYTFAQKGDLLVTTSGSFEAAVDIPILYPDTLFVSRLTTLESKGIPKNAAQRR